MHLLCNSISSKYPFRDPFQKDIETNTHDFLAKQYGTQKNVNKKRFFLDMIYLEELALRDNFNLIWVEIKSKDNSISVKAYPEETVDNIPEIKEGIIGPILKSFRWANQNGLDIPRNLDLKLFFWISDGISADLNNYPVFVTHRIPDGMNLMLFPDIHYFWNQGLSWDETKELFKGENKNQEDIIFFQGNTSSGIARYLADNIESVEIEEDPGDLHKEGRGKRFLLDLPESGLFKYLFLFEDSPVVIRVTENWEDSDNGWVEWIDTLIPKSAYLQVVHRHIDDSKVEDRRRKSKIMELNQGFQKRTLNKLTDTLEEYLEDPELVIEEPDLGHKIVSNLSNDRIYQLIYRTILTFQFLNRI